MARCSSDRPSGGAPSRRRSPPFWRLPASRKTVVPFRTHGGGGAGHAESDLAQLCPDAIVKPGLAVRGNGDPALAAQITAWLARIGVVKV